MVAVVFTLPAVSAAPALAGWLTGLSHAQSIALDGLLFLLKWLGVGVLVAAALAWTLAPTDDASGDRAQDEL